MGKWHPKPDDLTPHMRQVMEQAYEERERPKCSRNDFFDGFISALRNLSRTSFKEESWEKEA